MREHKLGKKKTLAEERRERILKFLEENREPQPVDVPREKASAIQKEPPQNKPGTTKKNLKSCLVSTPLQDQRLAAGENNPYARRTGKLPRVDEECQFNAPGVFFLKGRSANISCQEVFLKPTKPKRMELRNKCDFFPNYVDPSPFQDKTTQTLYRESSAQTLAYLPEIYNGDEARTLELFTLPSVLPGNKPPGLYEVEVFERARRRHKFLDAVRINLKQQRLDGRKLDIATMAEAFEWELWMEREERIQECQMMRLEIVIKMFDKREREMHAASKTRMERGCELIEKRRKEALRKNEIEYQRGMRRIREKMAKTSIRWQKQTPMHSLGSPCSDFYAPPMRYGVDPERRNFTSTTKTRTFNMRIDELEKQINMKIMECPFGKLKQWSQPKQRIAEIENRFCEEHHLEELHRLLKTLRVTPKGPKPKPQCLKVLFTHKSDKRGRMSLMPVTRYSNLYERNINKARPSEKLTQKEAIEQHLKRQKDHLDPQKIARDMQKNDLKNMLLAYEGSLIGFMMQFLRDEMNRMKEQRRLHFFSLLADKQRWQREAAEAGLRQKENSIRMLYEEMFQYSNSVNTDISEHYVHSILTTDLGYMAANQAAEAVTEMARQIDVDIQRWLESFKLIQNPLNYIPLRLMLHDMVCPDLNAALQRYEITMIVQYIVEDVVFDRIWKALEPYDISSTLTSDLIDRLIDNDLYLFSSESESETLQNTSWYEAHAIIRKLIRQSVPGRRWKEEAERIVHENYNDLLDIVFDEILRKFEASSRIEPVMVCRSHSDENHICDERCTCQQLPEIQSDLRYIPGTKIVKNAWFSLERKSSNGLKGLEPDKAYKGSPPNSLDSKFVEIESDVEDDPWPWLPDCKSRSSSQENLGENIIEQIMYLTEKKEEEGKL
ncbi:cilia- and flagella-associated protein 91 [Drosophila teissieri]|uniref:cilia- and flagella-associated protein 91 n=1 Tax=Drosophila teissieri TaxID=7243 RepID=UPI001CBA0C61|nr:cilia- and flagella-associated protein 91 [Drosophila teissieri]